MEWEEISHSLTVAVLAPVSLHSTRQKRKHGHRNGSQRGQTEEATRSRGPGPQGRQLGTLMAQILAGSLSAPHFHTLFKSSKTVFSGPEVGARDSLQPKQLFLST